MIPSVLFIFLLLNANGCESIDEFNSAANEFIFAVFPNHPSYYTTGQRNLHISTQESTPVTVTVRTTGGSVLLTTTTVMPSTGKKITLPYNTAVNSVNQRNKGIEVIAEEGKSIRVAVENYAQYTSDSYLVLPTLDFPVMNYTYYAVSSGGPYGSATAIIVAAKDNTVVTITPTQTITIPSDLIPGGTTVSAGNSATFTLNRLQTYAIRATGLDITGTKVFTTKPIALFTGHECGNVPVGICCCDVLMEQVTPTINWGKVFIFALLRGQAAGTYIKVLGHKSTTTFTLRCSNGLSQSYTLSGSLKVRTDLLSPETLICSITSNQPIFVVQLCPSQQKGSTQGDPFMLIVPPIEQFSTNVTFPGYGDRFPQNYVNVAVLGTQVPSGVYLGSTLITSGWTAARFPNGSTIGYVTQVTTSGIQYNLKITENRKMMVYVYGYDNYDSYGYVAGMDLLPTAEVPDCGPPDLPSGTQLQVAFSTTFYTSTANYSCNVGYTLIGNATRVCLQNSTWSGVVPVCQIINCGSLSVVPGTPGGLVVSYASTNYNSIATYSCVQEGYNLVGSSQRVCSSNSLWTGSAPSCIIVDCGTPGISSYGDIPSMLAYSTTIFNSTAVYSCEIGYNILGDMARTCLASGQWSGSAPECHIVTCESLFTPSGAVGGLMVLFGDVTYNSTATYLCNEIGYELIGSPERKCKANGNWSNTQPSCQLISCGIPDLAPGNQTTLNAVYASTTYSSVVTYNCIVGYNLIGTPQRICGSNKQWSKTSPYCQIVDCGLLSVPADSLGGLTVTFTDTVFNITATYSCPTLGFVLIGTAERTCGVDGNWSSVTPHCEIVPLNFTASAQDARTIDITWFLPPSAEDIVNHYIIEITSLVNSQVITYFSVQKQASVTNLHPHYSYSCRVAVVTTFQHPFTNPIIVQLPQAAPTASPLNPTLVVLSSTALNISWSPPAPVHQNGIITSYHIKALEEDTNTELQHITINTWLLLSNLHPHYRYTFTFAAFTIALGPYGSTSTVRMPEDVPTDTPNNITILTVDSMRITISWQPPPFMHQNGIVRKYILAVTEIETNTNFTVVSYNTSTNIYSLHPFYNYELTVAAYTIAIGPQSQTISIQTAQDVPSGPVVNISGYAADSHSINLMWSPPPAEQHNGIIIGYVINVTVLENNDTYSLVSQTSSTLLNTLKPYRTYTFAIAARTVIGMGPTGKLITIKTPQTAPTDAPSILSTGFGSRHITIHWDPPEYEEQNGNITHYVINVTEIETGVSVEHTSPSTAIFISHLHPAYTYQCSIAAFTIALGPFSLPQYIKTAEEAPSSAPVSLNKTTISPRNVVLKWEPPPPEDRNGLIVAYYLNITKLGSNVVQQFTTSNISITINNLKPYTYYSCIVSAATSAGISPYSTIFTFLTLQTAPSSSPMITEASVVNSKTVLMLWSPPPAQDHNGVIIKYIINITAQDTGKYRQVNVTGTSVVLTDLVASFTYYISVSAHTVETGPYSSYVTITLPQDVPTGFPRNVQANSPSPTSIFIKWSSPPIEEQSGDILQYIVNITHAGTLDTAQHTTNTTNITITNLEAYETYFCLIAAKTAIGIGPFSQFVFIQTQEDVPSGSPEHLGGVPVSSTSIHLTWDPPPLEHHNGEIDSYLVNVTEIATNHFNQHFINQTQITIENLHPFYAYHCQVTAVTVGEGPYTDTVVVVTDEAAPSTSPTLVSVTVLGSTSITMSWTPPQPLSAINGIIREYSVIIEDVQAGEVESYIALGSSINITNLKPFTEYSCQVAAVTVSAGPHSSSVNITTDQDAPSSPPEQFTSTAMSSSILMLQWSPPNSENIHGIIQNYEVRLVEQETGNETQITTIDTTITVTNLHPYYTYQCSVSAVTVAIGPSIEIIIQMPEDSPSSAPGGVTAVTISSTVIMVNWNSLPVQNRNGIIRYYTVRVIEIQTGIASQSNSTLESLSLNNLHPAYDYQIQVAAVTVSTGPFSSAVTTSTAEDVPSSPPTNLVVDVENSTTAHLSWDPPPIADHNGVITIYTIFVLNKETDEEIEFTTITTTFTVTDLDPFTNYGFSVTSSTTIGMGPESNTESFQTAEDAPSAAPSDFNVATPSTTSLLLTWSSPPDSNQNGIIRSYVVRVAEVDSDNVLVYSTTATSLTIGPVHPFTSYECSVAAVTVSQGPFSASVVIQTPQDAPSSPPSVNVTALNSTTVFITWEPLPLHEANGIITGYTVNVSVTETQTLTQHIVPTTELTLSALHPYYTYTIVVSATTVKQGPFSMEYVVRTPPAAPAGPPQSISADVLNATSVEFSWSAPLPEHQNGIVQSYTIIVLELETNSTKEMRQNYVHNSIVIHSLHPYYNYQFSVAAYTVALGPYENTVALTDQLAPTSPPLNTSITISSSTTALVQWSPPVVSQQNGIIQHYALELTEHETGNTLQYTTIGLHYTFHGLHAHYTYTCTIAVVTVGPGPVKSIMFQMPQDVPSGAPSSVQGIALNSTTLLLLWQAPLVHLHNGIITAYNIRLREVQTDSTTLHVVDNTTSTQISALHPSYQYEIQVAAVTIAVGPYSSTAISIQLPESAPNGHPLDVSGSALSPTSILLTWSPPSASDHNGVITGYVIKVTEINTQFTTQQTLHDGENITIISLSPFTNYLCTVAAQTSAGLGPFGPGQVIQTQESAPTGPPENAGGVTVSYSSIHLTWDPPNPDLQNGVIRLYLINLTEIETGMQAQYTINQTQITIENLHPFYKYNLTVAAVTVSEGPHSAVVSITTDQHAPSGPPLNLSFTALNSTSVTLQWSPPAASQQNGIVQHYTLQFSEYEIGDAVQYTTSGLFYTFHGLHPHYKYSCAIAAVTVDSGPAQPIVFQMPQDAPSGSPRNVSAVPVNATALLLEWLPPPLEQQNGIIVEYTISLTDVLTNTSKLLLTNSTSEYVVTELHPFYQYEIQIAATTIQTGPLSDLVSIQMPESEPSSAPVNFYSEAVVQLTAMLVWSPPPVRDHNGVLLGYKLSCISDKSDNISVQVEGATTTITDLTDHAHYTCTVCAYTLPGCGPVAVTYISTYDESPVGPPLVSVVNTSATSIKIMWTPPQDPENLTLGYRLTYQLVNCSLSLSTPRPPTTITNIGRDPTMLTLHPLLQASQYRIVMYTVTEQGTSPASDALLTKTAQYDSSSPRNFSCEGLSPNTLTCTWNKPELTGRSIVGYNFYYGLIEKFDYYPGYGEKVIQQTVSTVAEQHSISSLPAYGGYLVALTLFTIDGSAGTGVPEDVNSGHISQHNVSTVAFTAEQAPEASVRNLSVEVISPRSLSLSWLPPERVFWQGVVLHYAVIVTRLGPITQGQLVTRSTSVMRLLAEPKTNHNDPSLAVEPLQEERHVVENLEEYYQYSLSVAMVNSAGEGQPTLPITLNMPEAKPSGPPIDIQATNITSTSITFSWSPPVPLDANGIITGYLLNLTRNGPTRTHLLSIPLYTATDLRPYQQVTISIAAINRLGHGPFSRSHNTTTAESPPSAPLLLVVKDNRALGTVLLSWSPPTMPNGILVGYEVFYNGYETPNEDFVVDNGSLKTRATVQSVQISNLQTSLLYRFKVRALNGAGYGPNTSSELIEPIALGLAGMEAITISVPLVLILIAVLIVVVIAVCFVTYQRRVKSKRLYSLERPTELNVVMNNGSAFDEDEEELEKKPDLKTPELKFENEYEIHTAETSPQPVQAKDTPLPPTPSTADKFQGESLQLDTVTRPENEYEPLPCMENAEDIYEPMDGTHLLNLKKGTEDSSNNDAKEEEDPETSFL